MLSGTLAHPTGSNHRCPIFGTLLLAFALVFVSDPKPCAADWSTHRADAGRSGSVSGESAPTWPLEIYTKFNGGPDSRYANLIVSDRRVFMQNASVLWAIQFGGNTVLNNVWTRRIEEFTDAEYFINHPALYGDEIVAGVQRPSGIEIIFLDREDGQTLRRFTIENGTNVDMTATSSDIFMRWSEETADDTIPRLSRFDFATGNEDWTVEVDQRVKTQSIFYGSPHIFRQLDDGIAAHDEATGEERWRYDPNGGYGGYAVWEDSVFFVRDGNLEKLQGSDGSLLWDTDLNPECTEGSKTVVTDGNLVAVHGVCRSFIVVADFDTGEILWSRDYTELPIEGGSAVLPMVLADGILYAMINPEGGLQSDKVAIIDAASGNEMGRIPVGPLIPLSLALEDSLLYIASEEGGHEQAQALEVYEGAPSDMRLEMVSQPSCTGIVDQELSYRFRVVQPRDVLIRDVELSIMTSPSDNTVNSPMGSCSGNAVITCVIGNLKDSQSFEVELIAKPKNPGRFVVQASVSHATRDPNGKNNTLTREIDVTQPPPGDYDLRADWMEITQGIQNRALDVPLVAHKGTYVRLYPDFDEMSIPNVTAELRGTRGGEALPGSPLQMVRPCMTLEKSSTNLREEPLKTMNFLLPPEWRSGEVTLEAVINPTRQLPESDYDNNSITETVLFADNPPICLKTYSVLTEDSNGNELTSSIFGIFGGRQLQQREDEFKQRALTRLPTHEIDVHPQAVTLTGFGGSAIPLTDDTDQSNQILRKLYLIDQTSHDPQSCNDARSRTIYTGTIAADTNTDYGGKAIRGHDSMLVTFEGGSLTDGSQSPSGALSLAHEIGHVYGLRHIDCGGPDGPFQDDYPYDNCAMGPSGFDQFWATDFVVPTTPTVLNPDNTAPMMSYADPSWIPDVNWNHIASQVYCNDFTGVCTWPPGLKQAQQSPQTGSSELANYGEFRQSSQVLLISGIIQGGSTTLDLSRVEPSTLPEKKLLRLWKETQRGTKQGSSFAAQLLDEMDNVLSEKAFETVEVAEDFEGASFFDLTMEFDPQAQSLRILQDGTTLVERTFSPNAPTVEVLMPEGGEEAGEELDISWNANDPDGDDLTYLIQYSNDNGSRWNTLEANYDSQQLTVPTELLEGNAQDNSCLVRVIANDGANTAMDVSEAFTVSDRAPQAAILAPNEGETFSIEATVLVRGTGYDPEGGEFQGQEMTWFLDGEELDETGPEIHLTDLYAGTYELNLEVTDSENQVATDTLTFVVEAPAFEPTFERTGWMID
ncbi:MAG: PQQ-binding-like beta-propeller repeat protein [Sumerlaeia bacterium]